ncbi:MAG: hypothetical protein GY906_37115 [bacterium]|nr:hypothetical protein [bacterium]
MTVSLGTTLDPAWQGLVPVPSEAPPPVDSGQWPRMINLGEDRETDLVNWLYEELRRCWVEREPLVDDWTHWQAQYWARPRNKVRNWPFPRSANIVIPLTAISVEAVYARLFNTLFSGDPFYTLRPKTIDWLNAAPSVEEWFQTEIENPAAINMFRFCQDALMELCKLGTAVGKSGYDRDVRKSLRMISGVEVEHFWDYKNGACLDWVPLANFLIRLFEKDPQTSSWVGEEHVFTWSQLKKMSLSGKYMPEAVEEIKNQWVDRSLEHAGESQAYQEDLDEIANERAIWRETFKVQEIWCSFDVDNDGIDEEIVVDMHWRSKTVLAIRYNWYDDLRRPYQIAQYVPVEGRIYGIGIGKQNEQFQAEVTTIHRQRLDNATLANMRMLALKKGSGYGPKEPVFPGKLWFLDDVADVKELQMSEVYPSSYANEEAVLQYSERRTGVNEVILGQPDQGTPGTATGDLARLREGNKRFDMVLRNVRRWLGLLGTDLLANYQQFGDQGRHWIVEGEDGILIQQVLELPPTFVRIGAIMEVTASTSLINQETEQQQWLALTQIMENYYRGQMEIGASIMQITEDPTVFLQLAMQALGTSSELIKRLLETFSVADLEKLLLGDPDERQQQGQPGQPGQQGQPGGNGGQLALPPAIGQALGPSGPNGDNRLASILAARQGAV